MATYCREVRQVEDKFNGLKLNHILRRLSEVADTLANAAADQEPVLTATGVFASDQHKPLVRYEEPEQAGDGMLALGSGADQPSASSGPEVMELEEDPATELEPLVD